MASNSFDLRDFLRKRVKVVEHGREFQIHHCSIDKSKKTLWINVDKQTGFCFRCRERYSLIDIVKLIEDCSFRDAISIIQEGVTDKTKLQAILESLNPSVDDVEEDVNGVEVKLPSEYVRIKTKEDIPRYLLQRKVTFKDCVKHSIGYCREGFYKNRIIIPIFDEEGILVSFVARLMGSPPNNKVKKVLYPKGSRITKVLFNHLYVVSSSNVIVVTEGVFDALRVGKQGVALFGKHASQEQIKLLVKLGQKRKIVVMLDSDADDDSEDLAEELSELCNDVFIAKLPNGRKDPGECRRADLERAIIKAKKVEVETDLSNVLLALKRNS